MFQSETMNSTFSRLRTSQGRGAVVGLHHVIEAELAQNVAHNTTHGGKVVHNEDTHIGIVRHDVYSFDDPAKQPETLARPRRKDCSPVPLHFCGIAVQTGKLFAQAAQGLRMQLRDAAFGNTHDFSRFTHV